MTNNIFGTHQPNTLAQFEDVSSRAVKSALMADGHLGYVMPIGGVAGYRNQVSPVGVGFDIACGNCAIRTSMYAHERTHEEWVQIADEIQRSISFGVGRVNNHDVPELQDHELFISPTWSKLPWALRDKARAQLGTVGSGNHYVDVFADQHGKVWVGVHFGSRGLGHTIASGFLALSQGAEWGTRVPEREVLLDLDTPLGRDYWDAMSLAGDYAYAGRDWVARKVCEIIGAPAMQTVHNHHNFAWEEKHDGEDLVVIRKGATPAFPGQRGFVGGSMGDQSVILEGASTLQFPIARACELMDAQEAAMYSTVHGAGRVMSRTEAAGKSRGWGKKKVRIAPGKISSEMLQEWIGPMGVILRGGGLDEAPQAYRRLPDVLEAQGDTINVLYTLDPIIVVMAGDNEFDPYKD